MKKVLPVIMGLLLLFVSTCSNDTNADSKPLKEAVKKEVLSKKDFIYPPEHTEISALMQIGKFIDSYTYWDEAYQYLENWNGDAEELLVGIWEDAEDSFYTSSDVDELSSERKMVTTYPKNEYELYMITYGEGTSTYNVKDYITFAHDEMTKYADISRLFNYYNEQIDGYYPTQDQTPMLDIAKQAELVSNQYETVYNLIENEKKFTKNVSEAIHFAELEQLKELIQFQISHTIMLLLDGDEDVINYIRSERFDLLSESEKREFYSLLFSEFQISNTSELYFYHDIFLIFAENQDAEWEYLSDEDRKNLKNLKQLAATRILANCDEFLTKNTLSNKVYRDYLGELKNYIMSIAENKQPAEGLYELEKPYPDHEEIEKWVE